MNETELRKKNYYQKETVVNEYDQSRFGSRSGQWIKSVEEDAINEIINNCKTSGHGVVLDIPVGTGRMYPILKNKFKDIYGADFSNEMLNYASGLYDYNVVRCDAFKVPFSDNVFDLILSSRFIPHVDNLEEVLVEFYRVLKPDGILIFDSYNWTPRTVFPFLQNILGGRMYLHRKNEVGKISSKLNLKVSLMVHKFILPPYLYQFAPLFLIRFIEKIFSNITFFPRVRTYYALRKQE